MNNTRAYEMALLSEQAYFTPEEFAKAHTDGNFRFHSKEGTQFYTVWTDDELMFVFRGTEVSEFADLKADLQFQLLPIGTEGSVHKGFWTALDVVWEDVVADYNELCEERHVVFTGHSLGAALATLAMSKLDLRTAELYTFGSPRVGDDIFRVTFHYRFRHVYRFRNQNDVVTRHPMAIWDYRHVGTCYYFTGAGNCVEDPGFWTRAKQFIIGMCKGAAIKKVDSFRDHSVANYVKLTRGLPSCSPKELI